MDPRIRPKKWLHIVDNSGDVSMGRYATEIFGSVGALLRYATCRPSYDGMSLVKYHSNQVNSFGAQKLMRGWTYENHSVLALTLWLLTKSCTPWACLRHFF